MAILNYRLKITQTVGGEKTVTEAAAKGQTVDGALILDYSLDGAANKLFLDKKQVIQRRMGEIRLHIIFREGEVTKSRLSDGVNDGMFETYTRRLDVNFSGNDCTAHIEYSFGQGGEIIFIDVSAVAVG
ncbi:MAG: DUF1934 family protein [Clostridia bacterium]|nr:DUF1934 family protein [Clostridia bacterium]